MMKVLLVAALVAFAAADVSHLFRGNKPSLQPFRASRPLPVAPVPHAAPVHHAPGQVIGILRSESNINPDGSYQYAYDTENGISAQESGQLKQIGAEAGTTAQGSFQFTSPEGLPVVVQYIADENGFQPSSDVIPVPPPIPAAILRSLEYNAAHPEPEQVATPFGRRFRRAVVYY